MPRQVPPCQACFARWYRSARPYERGSCLERRTGKFAAVVVATRTSAAAEVVVVGDAEVRHVRSTRHDSRARDRRIRTLRDQENIARRHVPERVVLRRVSRVRSRRIIRRQLQSRREP